MKRLDVLRKELNIIENLQCLSYNLIEQCREYYQHEIECIEKYDSPNPDYKEVK
jgi:hypothetical protein